MEGKVGREDWDGRLEGKSGMQGWKSRLGGSRGKVGREGLKGRLEGKVAGKVDRTGSRKGGSWEVVARRWRGDEGEER